MCSSPPITSSLSRPCLLPALLALLSLLLLLACSITAAQQVDSIVILNRNIPTYATSSSTTLFELRLQCSSGGSVVGCASSAFCTADPALPAYLSLTANTTVAPYAYAQLIASTWPVSPSRSFTIRCGMTVVPELSTMQSIDIDLPAVQAQCSAPPTLVNAACSSSPPFDSSTPCIVVCNAGAFTTDVSSVSCTSVIGATSGTWATGGDCYDFSITMPAISPSLIDFQHYSLLYTVTPPTSQGGFTLAYYEFYANYTFPYQANDFQRASLKGLTRDMNSPSRAITVSSSAIRVLFDSQLSIERMKGSVSFRAVMQNGARTIKGQWSTLQPFQTHCSCVKTIFNDDWGNPYNITISQSMDVTDNQLYIKYTPNSMCMSSYSVSITTLDAAATTITPTTISHAPIYQQSQCSTLTPVNTPFMKMTYPFYSRSVQICMIGLPQPICPDCDSQYGNVAHAPFNATCVTFTPSFFITIRGNIWTRTNDLDTLPYAVPNIIVRVIILDAVTGATISDGAGSFIFAEGTTDEHGRYDITLSSSLLRSQNYRVLVVPYSYYTDINTGEFFEHQFRSTTSNVGNYTELMTFAQALNNIDFIDLSSFPITGSVILPAATQFYTQSNLQSCGVPNAIVYAYTEQDVAFAHPVRQSTVTDVDGKFTIIANIFTKLVVVPKYGVYAHTFSPSNYHIDVSQSAVRLAPFELTTENQVTLTLNGGLCNAHVGATQPVIRFESCTNLDPNIILPPCDQNGATYTLPAVPLSVTPLRTSDGVGLQSVVDGYNVPPDYNAGDLYNYLFNYPVQYFDLNDLSQSPSLVFKYVSQPTVTIMNEVRCSDPTVLTVPDQPFLTLFANQYSSVKFGLYETYGYQSLNPGGTLGPDRTTICNRVGVQLEIQDYVTQANTPLLPYYLQAPYSCTDRLQSCLHTPRYDESSDRSYVTYTFLSGDIEMDEHNGVGGGRLAPAYSRPIMYGVVNRPALEPLASLHVVLAGNLPDSLPPVTVPYPSYDALYILRDPAGGASYASIKQGSVLQLATALQGKNNFQLMFKDEVRQVCRDTSLQQCESLLEAAMHFNFNQTYTAGGTVQRLSTELLNYHLPSTIRTSKDPNLVNGGGDLFLTVDGSILLYSGWTLNVQVPVILDVDTCIAQLNQTILWKRDNATQFKWTSRADIQRFTLPQFQRDNQVILDQYLSNSTAFPFLGSLLPAYPVTIIPAYQQAVKEYSNNLIQFDGWSSLLSYDLAQRQSSLNWTDFHRYVRDSLDPNPVTSLFIPQLHNAPSGDFVVQIADPLAAVSQSQTLNDLDGSLAVHNAASFTITQAGNSGLLSFVSGGSPWLFGLTAQTRAQSLVRTIKAPLDSNNTAATLLQRFPLGTLATNVNYLSYTDPNPNFAFQIGVTHGLSDPLTQPLENSVDVVLADNDESDSFQINVGLDPVYATPVWSLIGGRSRCRAEVPELERDHVKMEFATQAFQHINPFDKVKTVLNILNDSPTQESFDYLLTLDQNSEQYGLIITVNNQLLSHEPIPLHLNYNEEVSLSVVIERGSNGYSFPNATLSLTGRPANPSLPSGSCFQVNASFSIEFDQPCADVTFAGLLSTTPSFLINTRTVQATDDGRVTLNIPLNNQEYSLAGRKWMDLYDNGNGILQAIALEYRPVTIAMTEADWKPVDVYQLPTALDILHVINSQYQSTGSSNNDEFSVEWDLSSLPDGLYQIRAQSRCRVPSGATDISLYTRSTTLVTGTLDIHQPLVFGTPLPTSSYSPGNPIAVAFDSEIQCDSQTFGAATSAAWINRNRTLGTQAAGRAVDIIYTCTGSSMNLQFLAPIWDDLVNQLVTIEVNNVLDIAGNSISQPVRWSFNIIPFNTMQSSVHIDGLYLGKSLSFFLGIYGSESAFRTELLFQLREMVNRAIDYLVKPTPKAVNAGSRNGIQTGAILISQLTALSNNIKLTLDIISLPQFPQDVPLPYSPSFFAHYLQTAILPFTVSIASPPIQLYNDYSIFQYVTSSAKAPLAMSVRPIPNEVQQAARIQASATAQSRHELVKRKQELDAINGVQANNVAAGSGVDSNLKTSTISLTWQSYNTDVHVLTGANALSIRYVFNYNPNLDPDHWAEIDSTKSYSIDNNDPNFVNFAQNVQYRSVLNTLDQDRAAYQITIFQFPSIPGGSLVTFYIDVYDRTGMTASQPNTDASRIYYSIAHPVFVVGVPAEPSIRAVRQLTLQSFQIEFNPSVSNGLIENALDADVNYQVAITPLSSLKMPTIIVPPSLITTTRQLDSLSHTVVQLSVALDNAASYGFTLPTAGNYFSWNIKLQAANVYGASAAQNNFLIFGSQPAYIPIYRVTQTQLYTFALRFYEPNNGGDAISLYNVTFTYSNETATPKQYSQQFTAQQLTVISSSPLLYECVIVLPNARSFVSNVQFAIQAINRFGSSGFQWHIPLAPSFVSPPSQLNVTIYNNIPLAYNEDKIILNLRWAPPTTILQTATLFNGYQISYSYTDGYSFTGSSLGLLTFDPTTLSSNFTLTRLTSPLGASTSVVYTVSFSALIWNSDNKVLLSRVDGAGKQLLKSAPLVIQAELSGNSFKLIGSTPAQQLLTQRALSPAPNKQVFSDMQLSRFEVLDSDGASLALPPQYSLTQIGASRILISFPYTPSSSTGLRYFLMWFDAAAASTNMLGYIEIDTTFYHQAQIQYIIEDPSLKVTDQQLHTFKFSLFTRDNTGNYSPKLSSFLQVRSYPVVESQTNYNLLVSILAIEVIFGCVLLVLAFILWRLLKAKGVKKRVSVPYEIENDPNFSAIPHQDEPTFVKPYQSAAATRKIMANIADEEVQQAKAQAAEPHSLPSQQAALTTSQNSSRHHHRVSSQTAQSTTPPDPLPSPASATAKIQPFPNINTLELDEAHKINASQLQHQDAKNKTN